MKPAESSSFVTVPHLSLVRSSADDRAQVEAFSAAFNALNMARHYLIAGNERAAERKANMALHALRQLLPTSDMTFQA